MRSTEPRVIELTTHSDYQPLLEGTPGTCGMRSGRVYLKQGEDCGQHTTGAHEETLVFLAGQGQSLIGAEEKPVDVGVGKVLYIPPHTLHNIRNQNEEPLIYIYCVAPITENTQNT